jgi:hypothetical protein
MVSGKPTLACGSRSGVRRVYVGERRQAGRPVKRDARTHALVRRGKSSITLSSALCRHTRLLHVRRGKSSRTHAVEALSHRIGSNRTGARFAGLLWLKVLFVNLIMVWTETSFHGLVFLLGQFDLGENGLNKQVG